MSCGKITYARIFDCFTVVYLITFKYQAGSSWELVLAYFLKPDKVFKTVGFLVSAVDTEYCTMGLKGSRSRGNFIVALNLEDQGAEALALKNNKDT